MGLENLQSIFNDLPNEPSVSPDNLSMSPTLEIKGRHGDMIIDKVGNATTDIPHPSDHSTLDDLIKQTEPIKRDENSPLSIKDDKIEFNSYYDASFIGPYGGFSGGDTTDINNPTQISFNPIGDRKKLRTGDEFLKLGENNRLGLGAYTLETLYNTDHTAVLNRQPIDTGKVDHLGKKIEINIGRAGMGDKGKLDIHGYSSPFRTSLLGPEPYIVNEIGSSQWPLGHDRDVLPYQASLQDYSRLGKFYTSWAGAAFMVKENITNVAIGDGIVSGWPPGTWGGFMAPPLPMPGWGNTGFLNYFNQSFQSATGGTIRKPQMLGDTSTISSVPGLAISFGALPFAKLGDRPFPPVQKIVEKAFAKEFPPDTPDFVKKEWDNLKVRAIREVDEAVQIPLNIRPTPFIDLSGGPKETDYIDRISLRPVTSTDTDDAIAPVREGDFYVRIKDLRSGNFIYFRGYVTGITENVTPSWTPTNYVGRSEPVYMYERAERDLSFNLRVYPANNAEFTNMYDKIEKLTSLAYPQYQGEIGIDEFGTFEDESMMRMKPPFTELYMAHIGSRVKGQFGFIKSLTYTVNESGDWDQQTLKPRLFDIAITYQMLSKRPPSLHEDHKFYGATV